MRSIVFLSLFVIGCSANSQVKAQSNTEVQEAGTDPNPGTLQQNDGGVDSDASNPSGTCQNDCKMASADDGIKNGDETDVDCGGLNAPKCAVNKNCLQPTDCTTAVCRYDHVCIAERSCTNHLGGDTCGAGEVGDPTAVHESCCKSLPVIGFTDSSHAGQTAYLDKYEITAGRIRAFVQDVTNKMGGKPNVKGWISANQPAIWNSNWSSFLPSDVDGDKLTINRLLLGDPRHDGQTPEEAGPGVILPPATDQVVSVGLNHQFGGQVFADLHGNNCGTFAGAYGFPTYYYPPDVQSKNGEAPRGNALDADGKTIPAQEFLDVKSMNCITNAMLAAFCAWDGGQLATADVMDFVTDSPSRDESVSGCGTQYDNHGDLLGNILTTTVQSGGRCPDVNVINATFDAGDNLPVPGSFLNQHNYHFPDLGNSNSDKTWEIAAPGRMKADNINGWMDIAGNLSESVLDTATGRFSIRFRGIGYGSSRSDLNATLMPGETILRLQRPEVKSALSGGRCMRFK